jgi:hypothetical protein
VPRKLLTLRSTTARTFTITFDAGAFADGEYAVTIYSREPNGVSGKTTTTFVVPQAVRNVLASTIGDSQTAIYLLARVTDNFNSGPVLCTFRLFTGTPCPFCGTTRAFGSLIQGNLIESLTLNPLALLIAAIVGLWVLLPRHIKSGTDQIVNFWWRMSEIERIKTSIMIFTLLWVANLPRMLNT